MFHLAHLLNELSKIWGFLFNSNIYNAKSIRLPFLRFQKKIYGWMDPLMDGDQLSQGYRATTRRQFTFYHSTPRSFWYSINRPWKDERLNWPWSQSVVLNPGALYSECSVLTTTLLFHDYVELFQIHCCSNFFRSIFCSTPHFYSEEAALFFENSFLEY